jgi:hypothetical protein
MKESRMSILVRFEPPSLTTEQYEAATGTIQNDGQPWPADGLELHVCFGEEPNLRVSEVWDSPEKFEAFGPRLMPVLEKLGIDPGEPTIIPVQNVIKR